MKYVKNHEIIEAIKLLHLRHDDPQFFNVLASHFMIDKRLYGHPTAKLIHDRLREEIWVFVCEKNKKEGTK